MGKRVGEYVEERVLVPATVIYAREVLHGQIDGGGGEAGGRGGT